MFAALSGAAYAAQNSKTRAVEPGTAAGSKYRLQNPNAFNPQPDPPTRKFLGGPDTKSLGGPDTKSLGGPDTKLLGGPDTKRIKRN
jgi:hypothetical protein